MLRPSLESAYDVWFDEEGMLLGVEFIETIEEAIEDCVSLIFIYSDDALASPT